MAITIRLIWRTSILAACTQAPGPETNKSQRELQIMLQNLDREEDSTALESEESLQAAFGSQKASKRLARRTFSLP